MKQPLTGNMYRIGKGKLYQINPSSVTAKKEEIIKEWDVPFINEMDPYDVFLIIEQQRYKVPVRFKEVISSKKLNFFEQKITFVEREGMLKWDVQKEEPIILLSQILPENYLVYIRQKPLSYFLLVLLLVFVLIIPTYLLLRHLQQFKEEERCEERRKSLRSFPLKLYFHPSAKELVAGSGISPDNQYVDCSRLKGDYYSLEVLVYECDIKPGTSLEFLLEERNDCLLFHSQFLAQRITFANEWFKDTDFEN